MGFFFSKRAPEKNQRLTDINFFLKTSILDLPSFGKGREDEMKQKAETTHRNLVEPRPLTVLPGRCWPIVQTRLNLEWRLVNRHFSKPTGHELKHFKLSKISN